MARRPFARLTAGNKKPYNSEALMGKGFPPKESAPWLKARTETGPPRSARPIPDVSRVKGHTIRIV